MDKKSGYVFALINPSLEGLVRIEVTTGSPQDAARDISTITSAAAPYILIFQQHFSDCAAAEEFVQKTLSAHRSPDRSGFYQVSTTEAVLAILKARNTLETAEVEEAFVEPDPLEDTAKTNRRKFCSQLLSEGRKFQYGDSAVPRNETEAIRLYHKAIDLNCPDADRMMGTLYYDRYVFKTSSGADLQEALKHYQDGIAKGNIRCWGDAARCYEKLQDYRNAEKSWLNFWTLIGATLDPDSRSFYADRFQEYMLSLARAEHRKATQVLATRVGSSYAELPEGRNERFYEKELDAVYGG